jgi:Astacin (Peptidase family M12A)/Divergent InlB B-repeat domain
MLSLPSFCSRTSRCVLSIALIFASILAAAAQMPSGKSEPAQSNVRPRPASVGVADPGSLWPGGTVYYQIAAGSGDQTTINAAITLFNNEFTGAVQWVGVTVNGGGMVTVPSNGTYVEINLDPNNTNGSCEVNSIGYPGAGHVVSMGGSGTCSITTILHEMGHIIGLYHEFTRTDRDSYVTVNYNNAIKGSWPFDFAINTQNQQLVTPYDYASVMQYPSFVLSRNGGPVIETIPAGIPLQGTEGVPGAGNQDYSAGDKEAILRLYGHAPINVTVTSNPVGLQVIIDGTTYTTPQTFTGGSSSSGAPWAVGTTHTLSVPGGVQTLSGLIENQTNPNDSATFYYTYGRWNDSAVQTHNITVSQGDGSPAFPTNGPAIATYSANFVQLVPYTETVFPSSSGSVSVSPQPQPQTFSGGSGNFFVARQQATLTATPASTYNFYEFNTQSPFFLPGGLSANPKIFYVPDTGNPVAVLGEFTTSPVYTVNVVPSNPIANDFSSNLGAIVDNTFYYTPQNFTSDTTYTNNPWTSTSSHSLNISSPQQPYSVNTEYVFSSWSDGLAQSHSITPSGSSSAYNATVVPNYAPATNFSFPPCGGTAAITPSSTEGGFYQWGTNLTYTATPDAGWTFAGWTYDLSGTANPTALLATDETLVYANFNTTNTPLTLTGLNPSSVVAGSTSFPLVLTGSGFTPGSLVNVNGVYLGTPTFVNSNTLLAQVPATSVMTAGTFDVFVENFPAGSNGCAVFGFDTFAVTAAGSGATAPTIVWTPVTEIVNGDSGEGVLNAATVPGAIGTFTYSAAPIGGSGTAFNATSGTSSLPPGTYQMTATFVPISPQYLSASVIKTFTVASETVWIINSNGSLSELTGDGSALSSSAFTGGNLGVSIDGGGTLWSVGTGNMPLQETNQVGAQLSPILSSGGIGTPAGIAIDGASQVWVTNANGSVSVFADSTAPLSPPTGFTDASLSTPSGIAIDLGGSVWIANEGNNSVTRILGAAAPAAPLATAAANNTTGAKP